MSREAGYRSVPIDNTVDGLRAYLSALNIRNKCKHPLFLVLRFDACIGLLYDASAVQSPAEDEHAFYAMMAAVRTSPPAHATGTATALAPFVVALKGNHDSHTACGPECPVRLSSGVLLPHASSLPPAYVMLCDRQLAALRKMYCRLHCTRANVPHAPPSSLPNHSTRFLLSGPPPSLCTTCETADPHRSALALNSNDAAQRHASAVLSAVSHLLGGVDCGEVVPPAGSGGYGGEDGGGEDQVGCPEVSCPEVEWQETLCVLAEAMAMHCRTRSAAEIMAFMADEHVSSGKRAATDRQMAPLNDPLNGPRNGSFNGSFNGHMGGDDHAGGMGAAMSHWQPSASIGALTCAPVSSRPVTTTEPVPLIPVIAKQEMDPAVARCEIASCGSDLSHWMDHSHDESAERCATCECPCDKCITDRDSMDVIHEHSHIDTLRQLVHNL